ncbi:protease inhibitor domain protein [Methanosarcina sp. MSH10X1]|uniref:protease inhibitor I42 family protein n=1 Tax=Methanosarcina sp. MSH10X1 TaxID=2507075 RepID=UPI000FFC3FAC|nr:protease inhibitor I42 family protein [Methanosarcina sp. MSH10X1]RXA19009.1 protease inhibitor domain protein [Methanosarcina sp. MSH10X1]
MIKKPFTIQFPENPVSGFSWDIATSNGLQVTGDRFVPEDDGKIGGGGYHIWDIQVTCQGSQKLTGTYRRGKQIASCFEIIIDAE